LPASPGGPAAPLNLISAARCEISGPAAYLTDPEHRAETARYLTDLTQPGGTAEPMTLERGQSYGEMAEPLVRTLVRPGETADLLLLAFSIHDLRPGRATAAYLSYVCPGTPLSFAICDQGSAAPFTGLRIARSYLSTPGYHRAVLIVAEQAALPYRTTGTVPQRHRAVAMLLGNAALPGASHARVTGLVQHCAVPASAVPTAAAVALAELSSAHNGHRLALLSEHVARLCPDLTAGPARIAPSGQPCTSVWWELAGLLSDPAAPPGLVVLADYEASLGYVCLAAVQTSGGAAQLLPLC
jgi:hypothetical protein